MTLARVKTTATPISAIVAVTCQGIPVRFSNAPAPADMWPGQM